MEQLLNLALEYGFTHAAPLDPGTLSFLPEVREMCRADRCNIYGKCWTCPPACGTLEECRERAAGYRRGFLVQTVGKLDDDFDYENMQETMEKHQSAFMCLADKLREEYPDMLPLGAGGCKICAACTYPDAPCRFPEKAHSSMEAYGLWVSDVCTKNNLPYNHGKLTIAYTSCFLL